MLFSYPEDWQRLGYMALAVLIGLGLILLARWLSATGSLDTWLTGISERLAFSPRARWRAVLLRTPFPSAWLHYLEQNVAAYRELSLAEQQKLRADLRIVVAEQSWEGCAGLTITEEMQVTIAGQACILLLGMPRPDYFSHVTSILVYPTAFAIAGEHVGEDGLVREGIGALGEAWYRGPVILAWDQVLAGGRREQPGKNVVYHEFAHQLDFLGEWRSSSARARQQRWRRWQQVMHAEYRQLVHAAERGMPTLLDKYGATNPAEMFAVASECFFELPQPMREYHPRLYEVLSDFYGQNPAKRVGK